MSIAKQSYALVSRTATRTAEAVRKRADLRAAKRKLLVDPTLLSTDKHLLREVSLFVYPDDGMYISGEGEHYLRVGLSAIRCIDAALEGSGDSAGVNPESILDLPCGYGRVLRFLRVRFPSAAITTSELDPQAVDFCARKFGTTGVMSSVDLDELELPGPFSLIWCGSLITHLDPTATEGLLRLLYRNLAPGGTCVFTSHGQRSVEWIESGRYNYLLDEPAKKPVLSDFHGWGYGYAGYETGSRYGVSVVSRDRMTALAAAAGDWKETRFLEHGWDDHQDVYAYRRR